MILKKPSSWNLFSAPFCQVWDANIIQTAEDDFYANGVADYIDALTQNITVRN